jgi:two-component system sensor histidine kinase/response regulator
VIAIRLISRSEQEPDSVRLEFSVQDSGIGIARDNQARIFSDFSQAESSTTRRFGGTGLGLAISKRLVALMGGQIALRSELGAGSTFSFVLDMPVGDPAPLGSAAMHAQVQALAAPAGPPSVLVVDDNQRSGDIMARMLGTMGWRADLAHSGQEALDRIRSHIANSAPPYDCIYVDWQMPHMDGWEFLRQLNSLRPILAGPFPRIIMLSANGRESLAQRTQEEQGLLNGFLVKPVTLSMVLDASRNQPADGETLRKSPRSSKRQLSGMRILVVEDNAINQQVAEELLGFEGALVSIAADGRQGVNAVASARVQFDAVLMDIQMPVMDGYAATRAIREQLGLTRLPIVGLTANAMASDREACLHAGMNEHMGKPFDMAQLVSLLIKLTGHQPGTPSPRPAALLRSGIQTAAPAGPPGPALPTTDIDVPAALSRMGGMRALYVQSARLLQTMLTTLPADLDERLQHADWQESHILLHSLKGNAATLGLNRLAGALRELEALCKTRGSLEQIRALAATLPPILESAQHALQDAISRLDEPERSAAHGVPASGDVSAARAVVELQLMPLLVASDLAVLDAFERARDALIALPPLQLKQLEDAMQALDLPGALVLCREITAT